MSERKGQIGADQHAEYERLEGVGVALENAREHDRPHQWLHWKTKATRPGSRPFGISCGSAPKGSTPFVRRVPSRARGLYDSTIFLAPIRAPQITATLPAGPPPATRMSY